MLHIDLFFLFIGDLYWLEYRPYQNRDLFSFSQFPETSAESGT